MGGIVLPNGYLYESGNSYICAVTFEQIQNVYIFGAMGITWVLYLIIVVYLILQVFYDFLTLKIAIETRNIFIENNQFCINFYFSVKTVHETVAQCC